MDGNSGATPNPLNATLGTNPAPAPTQPTPTKEPAAAPKSTVTESATPVASDAVTQSVPVDSLDPNGRPMEKVAPAAAPTKKKTGLIVGIIIGAVVLIGGIIAAVLLMMNTNKGDAVAQAMSKIMGGNAPTNVAIDGDITVLVNAAGSPIKRVNIDLDSDIITGSMINTSSAVLNFTTNDNKDFSVEFDEVYAANGDLYFKIDGITSVLEDSDLIEILSNGALTSNTAAGIIDVFEVVDGVWLKISTEEMNALGGSFVSQDSPLTCVTDLVTDLNKNSNSTAELYNKYPFVTSTTENVVIPGKQGPVYQVSLDSKNFADFANSSINSDVMRRAYECMGYEDNVAVDEAEIEKMVARMPKVYVEVNGNNDFTRLYLESDVSEGAATATIDLGFSYPTNVNVSEPVNYTDFSKVITQIMSGFYNIDGNSNGTVKVNNK